MLVACLALWMSACGGGGGSSTPGTISVPDVVGQTRAAATSAITGEDLVVGTVTTESSNTVPTGTVISQSPAGGTAVASGSG
jgi:beta-lactam-binding protein with PASTA domain